MSDTPGRSAFSDHGTPSKVLDVSRMKELGWTPSISLREGLRAAIEWYRERVAAEVAEVAEVAE